MFHQFKTALQKQFEAMKKHTLFRTAINKDELWNTYLNSFPEGTNPIFRERTEHDCQCCRSFIRAVGNIVSIDEKGKVESIWDVNMGGHYQIVADALSEMVKAGDIENIFLHTERSAGIDKNYEQLATGKVQTWEHFYLQIPSELVVRKEALGARLGETRTSKEMMLRALTNITSDSIETVLELIAQNSLLRGAEKRGIVDGFQKLKKKYDKVAEAERDAFCWANAAKVSIGVARIRDDVIGTLLSDLSEGKDLVSAVAAFENKVNGGNYMRTTALITKGMRDQAKKTIQELGLESALERRYAVLEDISINDILFADRSAKKRISGDVFDDIAVSSKTKTFDKVEEVAIDNFLKNILPTAKSVEVMFENRHASNLVSLIAPAHADAGKLFKWDNHFSWAYTGDVADSIKEKVKKAGGNVEGDLCCRLAWYNEDDLDFHMIEPGGYTIYYSNRRKNSPSGGCLDVDANGLDGVVKDPVENIFYANRRTMKEGIYKLLVHQYSKREAKNVGFDVEVDYMGTIYSFSYAKAVKDNEKIAVIEFEYTHAGGFRIIKSLPSTQAAKEVWGLSTQTFHRVNVVMLSPNHWDGQAIGNKHFFFMLDACTSDGQARGFYNEFLRSELVPHRKVFEIVGSKMMTEESSNQLSGLGFSSTQKNNILCRVNGAFERTIKIVF